MSKKVFNGLLAVALTTGILASSTTLPAVTASAAESTSKEVQSAQLQAVVYDSMWFNHNYLTENDGWVSTFRNGYFTVNSTRTYLFDVQQRTYDSSYDVEEVEYRLVNENDSSGTRYFSWSGSQRRSVYVTLKPGTYHVEYYSHGEVPVRIFGTVDPV